MILKFGVQNFKSIKDSGAIEFKPLTIFTGPNSSGKSNILEAVAVLAQTARLPRDISPTLQQSLLRGEFFRYPHPAVQFITYKKRLKPISFDIQLQLERSDKRYLETRSSSIRYSYVGQPDETGVYQGMFFGNKPIVEIQHRQVAGKTESRFISPPPTVELKAPPRGNEMLLATFLDQVLMPDTLTGVLSMAKKGSQILVDKLSRIYPISATRGLIQLEVRARERGPEEIYPPTWVGKNGEHIIEILSLIFGKREHTAKADKIVEWTEKFGIGKIKAGWWGRYLGSDFEDPVLKVSLETALASYGSKQLLTMITQMFWSEPSDVIMVEEPEISLHPESQVLVQELFAEVIAEGKQIICTTHSPFFVLALSRVIRSGAISRDEVAIYHVEKTSKGTKLRSLKLNERGFIVGWIPTYVKVEDQLFREWAEGLEQ